MDNNNEQTKKREKLSTEQVLNLLSELLNGEITESSKGPCVEERIATPINLVGEIWRYTADGETIHAVKKGGRSVVDFSVPEFLWFRLGLDQVCERYLKAYQEWEADNNGIPYLSTMVAGDDGETKWKQSYAFMDHFLSECGSGLHLLMAEFGMGKTSFCYGLRQRVAEPIGGDVAIKESFLSGEAAFPFVFLCICQEFRQESEA